MKRLYLFLGMLGIFWTSWMAQNAWSALGSPVQEQGASTGTIVAFSASTTPTLVVSTGSFMDRTGIWSPIIQSSTNVKNPGQMMWDRLAVEVCNDCGHDIWIGFTNNISSQAGANYGRRLPAQTNPYCISMEMRSPNLYVVSGTTETPRKNTAMQIK